MGKKKATSRKKKLASPKSVGVRARSSRGSTTQGVKKKTSATKTAKSVKPANSVKKTNKKVSKKAKATVKSSGTTQPTKPPKPKARRSVATDSQQVPQSPRLGRATSSTNKSKAKTVVKSKATPRSAKLSKQPKSKPQASSSKRAAASTTHVSGRNLVETTPPLSHEQLRKIKSGLTKRELQRYQQLLLEKRAEIIGDVQSMESDVRNKNADGNLSHVPMHMADIGSDNFEQEFTLGLMESERQLLREIDEALARIDQGIYGVCLQRGVPIGKSRLDAKPWAKYCIEEARHRERSGR